MKFMFYPPQAIHELGKRENQEDAIYPKKGVATDRDRLFILCDGMGGHEKGEVASNTICRAMAKYLDKNASADEVVSEDILLAALEYAYQQLDAIDDGAAKKMGTTLCLLLFHRGGLTTMHIGDSRIYHIRPSEHILLYQSKDHSLVYDLYQAGEISFDEMRTSPQKNIITRAIQPGKENRVRPSIVHISDIRPGDYFYICSDGMLEQMNNEEICDLFSDKGSDEKKKQQLIAETADNKDNHSAYFIHIKNVIYEESDDNLLNDEQTSTDNALNIKPHIDEAEADVVTVVSSAINNVPRTVRQNKSTNNKKSHRGWLALLVSLCVVVLLVIGEVVIKPFGRNDKPLKENFDKGNNGNKLENSENNKPQETIIRTEIKTETNKQESKHSAQGAQKNAAKGKANQQQATSVQFKVSTSPSKKSTQTGNNAATTNATGTKSGTKQDDGSEAEKAKALKEVQEKFKQHQKGDINKDQNKDVKNNQDNGSNV